MEVQTENLSKFLKCGIIVLGLILLLTASYKFVPKVISVSSNANGRELPIYCVDTGGKPKVSLSFDAAWGAGKWWKASKYRLSGLCENVSRRILMKIYCRNFIKDLETIDNEILDKYSYGKGIR